MKADFPIRTGNLLEALSIYCRREIIFRSSESGCGVNTDETEGDSDLLEYESLDNDLGGVCFFYLILNITFF